MIAGASGLVRRGVLCYDMGMTPHEIHLLHEQLRRQTEEALRQFMIQMEIDRRVAAGQNSGSFKTVFRNAAGQVTGVSTTQFRSGPRPKRAALRRPHFWERAFVPHIDLAQPAG